MKKQPVFLEDELGLTIDNIDSINETEEIDAYNLIEHLSIEPQAVILAAEDSDEEYTVKQEDEAQIKKKAPICESVKEKIKRFRWRNDSIAYYILQSNRTNPVKGRA